MTRIAKRDWKWLLLLVFFEPFLYFIGESAGLRALNSPTISSVIISTIPIIAMIAGVLFYKEKMSGLNIFGVLLTLPGILLMVYERGTFDVEKKVGLLFLGGAVLAAVGYSMVARSLAFKYNSYTIATYQHALAALYFLPFFLIYVGPTFSFKMLDVKTVGAILFLAILCSALAFVLFLNALRELGVARANIFTAAVPAVSAFAAFALGQEVATIQKIGGVLVVILGVVLAQYNPNRGEPAEQEKLIEPLHGEANSPSS